MYECNDPFLKNNTFLSNCSSQTDVCLVNISCILIILILFIYKYNEIILLFNEKKKVYFGSKNGVYRSCASKCPLQYYKVLFIL